MCKLYLVTLQCVRVKLLSMLLVIFFAFGTLQTVFWDLSLVEINPFYTERRKACFEETSLHHYKRKEASFEFGKVGKIFTDSTFPDQ